MWPVHGIAGLHPRSPCQLGWQSSARVSETKRTSCLVGRDSIFGIAPRYGLDCRGIELRWGRDFPLLSRPALEKPSRLHNGYRLFFRGVKRPGRGVDHPPHLLPRLKSRAIPLFPFLAFMACCRVNFTLPIPLPPTSVTWLQLLRKQTNTGTPTALTAEIHCNAHAISRSLPTCDISLGSLTVPTPGAGDFAELLLIYMLCLFSLPCFNQFNSIGWKQHMKHCHYCGWWSIVKWNLIQWISRSCRV